ncbi:MAG: CBS domain-containing protein [Clostridia bacterium]|nr:CBS domain-containing protein [Clostridia bacterium]NCC42843.1 CBS domain-containing protein [Clostridia bacterium]
MNILFFLTPKSDVAYVYNDDTLRQVLEKIEYHKYTAIPMLNKNGRYVGTVTEGDLLRVIKERYMLNIKEAEDYQISRVPLRWKYTSVSIDCNMEDLVEVAMRQNYVPVVDDADNFIGIIRRSDILKYCYKKSRAEERCRAEEHKKVIIE